MTQNKAANISRFLNRICKEVDAWTTFVPVKGSNGEWYPSCLDSVSLYNVQAALDYEQSILDEAESGIILDILEVVPDKEYAIIAVQ